MIDTASDGIGRHRFTCFYIPYESTISVSDQIRQEECYKQILTVVSADDVEMNLLSGLQPTAYYESNILVTRTKILHARDSRTYNTAFVFVFKFAQSVSVFPIIQEYLTVGTYAGKMIPGWRVSQILDELRMRFDDLQHGK